jgi:hypothetical protein
VRRGQQDPKTMYVCHKVRSQVTLPEISLVAHPVGAGRPKDREDINALCQQLHIRTRKQAQRLVDRYIPNKQVQQLNHLDDTLDDLFP